MMKLQWGPRAEWSVIRHICIKERWPNHSHSHNFHPERSKRKWMNRPKLKATKWGSMKMFHFVSFPPPFSWPFYSLVEKNEVNTFFTQPHFRCLQEAPFSKCLGKPVGIRTKFSNFHYVCSSRYPRRDCFLSSSSQDLSRMRRSNLINRRFYGTRRENQEEISSPPFFLPFQPRFPLRSSRKQGASPLDFSRWVTPRRFYFLCLCLRLLLFSCQNKV